MRITMVKKQLASGEPCEKCAQTEEMLRRRGFWDKIDEVVWVIEGQHDSPGLALGRRHGIELAPFFVVEAEDGSEATFTSALKMLRELFPKEPGERRSDISQPVDVPAVAERLSTAAPAEILRWGLEHFGERCAIAFSGAEDVALIDMATRSGLSFRVITLDTGRLHAETYKFLDDVGRRYGISIEFYLPDEAKLSDLVRQKGSNSFYREGHRECCAIRKTMSLRRALLGFEAWVSGERTDQNPAAHAKLAVVQEDPAFDGARSKAPASEGGPAPLIRLNPLANWSYGDIWTYIRDHDVPRNELHERGYTTIDCQPCTRTTKVGDQQREGRWWWESAGDESGMGEPGGNLSGDGI